MTDAEMQALRAAAEKATPGPWVVAPQTPCRFETPAGAVSISWRSNDFSQDTLAELTAAYIALANPAAVLALLDRVAAAEAAAAATCDAVAVERRGRKAVIHALAPLIAAAGLDAEAVAAVRAIPPPTGDDALAELLAQEREACIADIKRVARDYSEWSARELSCAAQAAIRARGRASA